MILGHSPAELDAEGLLAAYPWPAGRRWVRAMMSTSLDGSAVGPDGLSGSLSSAADTQVFESVRALADAVLVGAGTLRAEGYGPIRTDPAHVDRRRAAGLADAPRLVVVSGSLDLAWRDPVFAEATVGPLVVTGAGADPDRLAEARAHVDVVVTPGDRPTAPEIVAALDDAGLARVVCEGGPSLLADLVAAGLVDEADITVSPLLVGSERSPDTPGLADPARFDLVHVIEADGFLMNRYTARR